MRRREFISLLGGAAVAWPLAAQAQPPAMPVIGFLNPQVAQGYAEPMRGSRQGLTIVPAMSRARTSRSNTAGPIINWIDCRRVRSVSVCAVPSPCHSGPQPGALRRRSRLRLLLRRSPSSSMSPTIRSGMASSRSPARPGGNLTGVSFRPRRVGSQAAELLRALVPSAARVAVLVNPSKAGIMPMINMLVAGRPADLRTAFSPRADCGREINAAFERMGRERPDALFVVSITPFFVVRRVQLVQLAAFHRLPAAYGLRDFAEPAAL